MIFTLGRFRAYFFLIPGEVGIKNRIVVLQTLITIKSTPIFFFFSKNNNSSVLHYYSMRNIFQLFSYPHWTCLDQCRKLISIKLSGWRNFSLSDIVQGIDFSLALSHLVLNLRSTLTATGLPRLHSGKESACQCRRHKRCRLDPWVRKIPRSGKWQPL